VGLFQIVSFPTRLNNTLNILATNGPDLVEKCEPIPGISEHEAVYGELSFTVKIQAPARRTINMWQKADFNKIRQHISNFSSSFLDTFSTSSDVDLLWNKF